MISQWDGTVGGMGVLKELMNDDEVIMGFGEISPS